MPRATKTQLIDHIDAVARHYDFSPIAERATYLSETDAPHHTVKEKITKKQPNMPDHPIHRALTHGIRSFYEHGIHTYRGHHLIYTIHEEPPYDTVIGFHAIDLPSSLADALLIQVARSLLTSLGYEKNRVRVNMIGDKDSKKRFGRELSSFFRRNFGELPLPVVELVQKDVMHAYNTLLSSESDLAHQSPMPIDHLNDKSRRYLRELLDYMDIYPETYEIDPRLVGDYSCHNGTIVAFDILSAEQANQQPAPCSVFGGRYDSYTGENFDARHTSAGITFIFPKTPPISKKPPPDNPSQANIALVEIGLPSKMYGFAIMDVLFSSGIHVHHVHTILSLTEQLSSIQKEDTNILLIAGAHETLRREVIVRDIAAEKQQAVPLTRLMTTLAPLLKKYAQ